MHVPSIRVSEINQEKEIFVLLLFCYNFLTSTDQRKRYLPIFLNTN